MSTSHFELLKVYLDRKAIKTLVTKLDRNCAVNRGGNLPDLALRLFKITVSLPLPLIGSKLVSSRYRLGGD